MNLQLHLCDWIRGGGLEKRLECGTVGRICEGDSVERLICVLWELCESGRGFHFKFTGLLHRQTNYKDEYHFQSK